MSESGDTLRSEPTDPPSSSSSSDAVRSVLDHARDHLESQVHEFGVEGDAAIVDDNFADSAAVTAEHSELQALAAGLQEQLDDVERALARLDDGTYGTCEVCGVAVGEARLEALPATRFCIDHAG